MSKKDFIQKFHEFNNDKYKISIKWITKKMFWFFPLKYKDMYHSCKKYQGDCICKGDYIGET